MKALKRYMALIVLSVTLVSASGCGVISRLSTPTVHEEKIPAEYSLKGSKDKKILVLVEQPGWMVVKANMRKYITDALNKRFVEKAKISSKMLISYEDLSAFRLSRPDFSLLSPASVGRSLGADLVLRVTINGFRLNELAQSGYYKGSLNAQVVLIDAGTGQKLWPESENLRAIKVGFEVEDKGSDVAARRLAAALAHCTVRYFYNCSKAEFKIQEERIDEAWESWEN